MLLIFILLILSVSFGGLKVVEKELENGVKIIVKETKGKGIVSGVIFFKGGKHGEKKAGETNLLFILLLKGTKNFPTSYDVSYPFEKYGGFIYSSSGDDFSEIGFATKVEGLGEGLKVIEDILKAPLFKEEDLEREKKNVIVSIRSKRERGMEFAMEHLRKLTFKGTPYEYSALGTEETVQEIKREDIVRRWEEVRRGGNIVVSITGDINAEDIIPQIERVFSQIPEGRIEISEDLNPIKESEEITVKREGTQSTILCAFNAPHKDTEEYFAFKVLNSVLGDGMTSKLFIELREKRGYAYATYSFYPTRYMSPRLFAYIGTSTEKTESALKDLLSVVKNPEITEEDIELAKKKIIGDFLLDHQTRLRQAWYLGFYEVMGFGWEMDMKYTEKIKEVTLKDVNEALKKYINYHHCVIVRP